MDQPLVKHYRVALAELQAWGDPVSQANLDRHVIGQLTGEPYRRLGRKPFRETRPLYDQLAVLTAPTPVRVEGTGPWKLFRCACCQQPRDPDAEPDPDQEPRKPCLIICTCPGLTCTCDAERLCTVRVWLTEDLHHVAPHGIMDSYALCERLTGEAINDWPYADFRSVDSVIGRSLDSPLWPWTSPASESPPGE